MLVRLLRRGERETRLHLRFHLWLLASDDRVVFEQQSIGQIHHAKVVKCVDGHPSTGSIEAHSSHVRSRSAWLVLATSR